MVWQKVALSISIVLKYVSSMDEFVRRPKGPKINLDSNPTPPEEVVPSEAPLQVVPEPVEANEKLEAAAPTPSVSKAPKPKKSKFSFNPKNFKVPTPKTKKQWIIAGVVMALLLGLASYAVYYFIIRDDSPPVVQMEPEPEPEAEPEPILSTVTGREVTAEINERPVYAVQIENSPEARPQSGLMEADIVSEAIAEGGITRFNAIFHDNIPANIGPIRSLRPYYIDWFLPYDAAIVHAGGSGEALSDVRTLNIKDVDNGAGGIFRRVSQRYSPHNLYSTGSQALDLMRQRGYSSKFTGLPRKEAAPATTPTAGNISLRISSGLYNVGFVYDPTTNKYLRSQGGGAHVDAESGKQLSPDVVVVPIMSRSTHPDRVHTQYGSVGSGKVYVFQDGVVTEGTWTKAARNAQWKLTDAAGKPIELNPGQTWFSMVESADRVSYTP